MKLKYVMLEERRTGFEIPLLFPASTSHDVFYASVQNMGALLSAGFCDVDGEGNWTAFGESISLKIKSRPQDSKIMTEIFQR